jgi:hypothetical protein
VVHETNLSSGLPASDRGVAFLGGFGVDIGSAVTVEHATPGYAVPFDEVYTIEVGAVTPINNAYMSWDSADGAHITVQQAGWYCVGLELTWASALTGPVHWAIGSAMSIGPTGSGLQDTMCAGALELDRSMLCWIDANQILAVELDATTLSVDPTLQYALLTFTPLFTLA